VARLLRTAGAAAILGAALPLAAQQPVLVDTSKHAPPPASTGPAVVTPAADQTRGIDAEVRAALFDLVSDRPLAAVNRLQWLASSPYTLRSVPGSGRSAREDLLFLLAESYYRLGLSSSFRASSQELLTLAPAGRYASLIQMQRLLDAYRRGDYAGAKAQAAKVGSATDAALSDFVIGLAAYQTADAAGARARFAKVTAGGNPAYAPYASYMDAIAAMQGDTAKAAAAAAAIAALAAGTPGPFADQAWLTAAQLASMGGRFDSAAAYAARVSPAGGLASDAQLTRAWALYRTGRYDSAAALFGDYATRWPQLPGRDEARLMHGQILLEQRRAAEAASYFTVVGDSLGGELAALQARMNAAMAQAARALVAARAAGALYVREADRGKSLRLAPDAGAENAVVVAAFAGAPAPPRTDSAPPAAVTLADLQARFSALSPPLPADVTQRPFYAPASSPKAYPAFAATDESLLAADLYDAVARYRLQAASADHAMRIVALRNLQALVVEGSANLTELNRQIATTEDSLGRMTAKLVAARGALRAALVTQAAATAKAATTNIGKLDSLRASLGSAASPIDADILATEMQTALVYRRLAQLVASRADSAISNHPAYALRDSLQQRLVRAHVSAVQGQQTLDVNRVLVAAELARLEASESDRMRAARQGLSNADQQRAAAESRMVALLDDELRARAAQMVDALKRSREAADYGSASAAFFMALEAKTAGDAGSSAAAPAPAPER